jgi:hypothetical protein
MAVSYKKSGTSFFNTNTAAIVLSLMRAALSITNTPAGA